MNTCRLPLLALCAALGAAFSGSFAAGAADTLACGARPGGTCAPIVLAQSDCGAAASRVASEQNGQVVGAPQLVEQGGRMMCVVTILVRDPSGERPPTRKQVTVPAQ